jgi:hypothetical protein
MLTADIWDSTQILSAGIPVRELELIIMIKDPLTIHISHPLAMHTNSLA